VHLPVVEADIWSVDRPHAANNLSSHPYPRDSVALLRSRANIQVFRINAAAAKRFCRRRCLLLLMRMRISISGVVQTCFQRPCAESTARNGRERHN
jgi:hypothetical protein